MDSTGTTQLEPLATAFELDDDIILFTPDSGDLFLLNPTAALIWQGMADGLGLDDITDTLAAVTNLPRDQVQSDCTALVAEWQRAGILAGGESTHVTSSDPIAWWTDETGEPGQLNFEPGLERDYQLVDFRFRLRTADSPVDRQIHELLAHLETPDSGPDDSSLDVFFDQGQWCLYYNGRLVDQCTDPEVVVPMVHANLMVAAYRRSECLVALHAAAVTANERCVLLAGVPGSGKSTLTSALLARGFNYCADDTALLTPPPVQVRGVPTRLGVKEGSWPVVRELWPELDALPVYRRADGKRIRYLLPAGSLSAGQSQGAQTAHILIFPHYQADSGTVMQPLRRADALLKVSQSGYDIPDVIDSDCVSVLIDWMSSLDCYELHYSDIDEAVERVSGVLR